MDDPLAPAGALCGRCAELRGAEGRGADGRGADGAGGAALCRAPGAVLGSGAGSGTGAVLGSVSALISYTADERVSRMTPTAARST